MKSKGERGHGIVRAPSPLQIYGEAAFEYRRGAEAYVNEEWEGAKAGEGGPVMGGVAVRYELPNDCDVELGKPSW